MGSFADVYIDDSTVLRSTITDAASNKGRVSSFGFSSFSFSSGQKNHFIDCELNDVEFEGGTISFVGSSFDDYGRSQRVNQVTIENATLKKVTLKSRVPGALKIVDVECVECILGNGMENAFGMDSICRSCTDLETGAL